jgi:hypothetical protein
MLSVSYGRETYSQILGEHLSEVLKIWCCGEYIAPSRSNLPEGGESNRVKSFTIELPEEMKDDEWHVAQWGY